MVPYYGQNPDMVNYGICVAFVCLLNIFQSILCAQFVNFTWVSYYYHFKSAKTI